MFRLRYLLAELRRRRGRTPPEPSADSVPPAGAELDEEMQEAMEACADLAPEGGPPVAPSSDAG